MKKSLIMALALLGSASAFAQFQKPEDAVKYRQSAFTVMGAHFSRIGAMVSGKAPYDAKQVQDNARIVATMAPLPWAGFAANTESVSSKAKPEIWKDAGKFKELADKLVAASAALDAAAKSGDQAAVKTAFGAAAGTCKACHDDFRSK